MHHNNFCLLIGDKHDKLFVGMMSFTVHVCFTSLHASKRGLMNTSTIRRFSAYKTAAFKSQYVAHAHVLTGCASDNNPTPKCMYSQDVV